MREGIASEDDLQNYSWVVTSWQQQQYRPLQHRSTMILILAVYMVAWLFSFAISDTDVCNPFELAAILYRVYIVVSSDEEGRSLQTLAQYDDKIVLSEGKPEDIRPKIANIVLDRPIFYPQHDSRRLVPGQAKPWIILCASLNILVCKLEVRNVIFDILRPEILAMSQLQQYPTIVHMSWRRAKLCAIHQLSNILVKVVSTRTRPTNTTNNGITI
ncbi:hypothetical protein IV203_026370 [Nitzschia inconspicua]|uniref:Uncharacterized protein n=1 Tax=Nitzschia inconspicua TaxID=303405 RepID=A0A9K3PXB7_9STRA|nr:hypothetical protein IV203_026370 [Nitzschia inconspicua]